MPPFQYIVGTDISNEIVYIFSTRSSNSVFMLTLINISVEQVTCQEPHNDCTKQHRSRIYERVQINKKQPKRTWAKDMNVKVSSFSPSFALFMFMDKVHLSLFLRPG